MRHGRGPTLLWFFAVVAALGSGLACSTKSGSYTGRWECSSGGRSFFEIRANEGAFLVTDESGKTFPASVDDKGTLVMNGVPLIGSLPLPIDSQSRELICSACRCNRYARKSDNGPADAMPDAVKDVEAQRKTVTDVRNIGTAMFSWLTDQVGASAAGQSQNQSKIKETDLTQYSLISKEGLEKILVPKYIATIPAEDGWGHPYEFYLNEKNVLAPHVMTVRSAGRDGRFSASIYSVSPFPPNDFDEDIVWSDGYFVRWPQKPQ